MTITILSLIRLNAEQIQSVPIVGGTAIKMIARHSGAAGTHRTAIIVILAVYHKAKQFRDAFMGNRRKRPVK